MTEMQKFDLFINERIMMASSNESIAAYRICRQYVNEHFKEQHKDVKASINTLNKTNKDNRVGTQEKWEAIASQSSKLWINETDLVKMETRLSYGTVDMGIIDYYPKANKVLVRMENRWIPEGLIWLMDYINTP